MPPTLWTPSSFDPGDAYERGATAGPVESVHTIVVNDSDLPDDIVTDAARAWMTDTYFAENASLAGAQSTFQTYINDGSLLAKHRYRTPTNVIEEMKLARDIAERDDDVRAIIGGALALAFEHIEQYARDHQTVEIFEQIARSMKLRNVLKEIYREYLITSTCTTVHLFKPIMVEVSADSDSGEYNAAPSKTPMMVACPQVGILPGENIRVIGSDLFGDQALAYWPGDDARLTKFLREFFDPQTSAARKNEMRKEDPVSTTLFIKPVNVQEQQSFLPGLSFVAYLMNPAMVNRITMAKGFWPYPRPLLAACFPMLEAKRLLNIMDFALLQGAANYIVVAKKGSDTRPALPAEITQLRELIRHVGRTGVIVGDHRLSFEILTPKLDDLLAPQKRNLIGRKIAMALLRKPENVTEDSAATGAETEIEWIARVITDDRRDITDLIHNTIWEETVRANPTIKEAPRIWCPKIILNGSQFFTDFVIKLRDRGDIPRRYAVEAAGYSFEAALSERQYELDHGVDDVLIPAPVPYTVPAGVADKLAGPEPKSGGKGPQDNNAGRTPGGVDNRAPVRVITRNTGETVKAWREGADQPVYRMGEVTRSVLKTYEDSAEIGRLTRYEQRSLDVREITSAGPLTIVPVNVNEELGEFKAIRLHKGASMVVGVRDDGAVLARVLTFRRPEFDELAAQETAMGWGFPVDDEQAP